MTRRGTDGGKKMEELSEWEKNLRSHQLFREGLLLSDGEVYLVRK